MLNPPHFRLQLHLHGGEGVFLQLGAVGERVGIGGLAHTFFKDVVRNQLREPGAFDGFAEEAGAALAQVLNEVYKRTVLPL